ncbi:hypothetical protein [Chryseobacterium sp.]|nr:hypothetical protein [Chryseobacterium sp.]
MADELDDRKQKAETRLNKYLEQKSLQLFTGKIAGPLKLEFEE